MSDRDHQSMPCGSVSSGLRRQRERGKEIMAPPCRDQGMERCADMRLRERDGEKGDETDGDAERAGLMERAERDRERE